MLFRSVPDAQYSNTGYSILGAIIDSVTNQPGFGGKVGYEDYLWWNVALHGGQITEPTMTSMCLDTYWRHASIKDVAQGYQLGKDNKFEPAATISYNGWEGPPGGWDMTIGDLARLTIALRTNTLLDAATTNDMTSSHSMFVNQALGYGYGTFVGPKNGRLVYMHNGNIEGYTARYTIWPDDNLSIVLLANRSEANLRDLDAAIAALFLSGSGLNNTQAVPRMQMTKEDVMKKQSPEYIVARQHRQQILAMIDRYVRQAGSLDGAYRLLAARLAPIDPSQRLVRALERGDYHTASAVYLQLYPRISALL